MGSNNLTLLNVNTGQTVSFSNNQTNTGWTLGAGIEWAFVENVSAKLEYDYVGLSTASFAIPTNFPNGPGGRVFANDVFANSNRNISMLTLGINVLFH